MLKCLLLLFVIQILPILSNKKDEVIILPGLRIQPTFKHYSGYLNGSDTRLLHYWFVESQNSPSRDPLVLWLNGGPGCSSLLGLLTENGPFRVSNEGYITYNQYSWNKIANVLYLESPACVGFSYSTDGNCDASDDSTSILNYNALQHFLVKFPEYKNRDFYITGESYAGFYIPVLSERIISKKPSLPVQFKGIAVGNGLSSWSLNTNGGFHFAYNHGLISDSLWSEILSVCCRDKDYNHCDITGNNNTICRDKINRAMLGYQSINIYNIYSECYSSSIQTSIWSKLGVKSNLEKMQILFDPHPQLNARHRKLRQEYNAQKALLTAMGNSKSIESEIPCINDDATASYLNNPKVRYAIHIPERLPPWTDCSSSINFTTNYENMTSQYNKLFKLKNFKTWIYNGDVDMACSYLSDEWFFENFKQKVIIPRKPWFYYEKETPQIGGFVKVWENFVLLTIRGSGHMVPTDRPFPAYHMFEYFITGNSL